MSRSDFPLLAGIDSPSDLRDLPEQRLPAVVDELRGYLLESVSQSGGHLGAGLGTVELTVALHYILNTPDDRIVWDVGHQTYPHKILTGRADRLGTIRKDGGLAPFPKREESPYDTFGVGHSSTSISAALGMALAAEQSGSRRKVVAVIGDGALTAGMAFEALDHAGDVDADLLVILNDNEMSISPNVGALSSHLTRLLSGPLYNSLREGSKWMLDQVPPVKELARRAEEHVKGMAVPGTLFEELNFNYYGPVDGHDLPTLLPVLRNLVRQRGPRLLHVVTRKGKGYAPAEADPVKYHGVSPFDPAKGIAAGSGGAKKAMSYSAVFGRWLCDAASADARVVGITPAMREGSGMVEYAERFPERYFDVGIAEQHSVTLAAGMACDGLRPVVAIYSTFLQRAYDQLIHDVAIQNLPVVFAIDRAGLVGPDGPTHAGSFDLSYLRCIPNMTIMAPADEAECYRMLSTGLEIKGPSAVRYPRGNGMGEALPDGLETLPVGRGELRSEGREIAILAFGSMLQPALEAAEELDATVANMRFVKPLDTDLIRRLAEEHALLVTVEENAVAGGAGSGVLEFLQAEHLTVPVLQLGLEDEYLPHGSREALLAEAGLDAAGIAAAIRKRLAGTAKRDRLRSIDGGAGAS
ncbi:1-deoxy-D-xylulose-5-phosphate synthase [Natronocella acetinitrilica]|uniref:1-deoxy-D-xylulose-5-phosphate synthase n=1 Tax=Natronocella acetinitrilica TaxID=414046 RepID=A0AAE3G0W1_9GAMM|nr:1-deoxy-D-xylulose-5-phosphate synthase [Natronocella acetinitrilica]MCP1673058.1 1-deoxy-D-xylulose-5-phosphate synthase [Natronocella acetinitrilica]